MFKTDLQLSVLFCASIAFCFSAIASEDQERTVLARLLTELNALQPLIIEAESVADTNARYPFDYSALEHSLEQTQQSIRQYLDRERRDPRTLPARQEGIQ